MIAVDADAEEALDWEEMPGRKESRMSVWLDVDPMKRSDWPEQHQWLRERLAALYRVFTPRVKGLNAAEYNPAEESREGAAS